MKNQDLYPYKKTGKIICIDFNPYILSQQMGRQNILE